MDDARIQVVRYKLKPAPNKIQRAFINSPARFNLFMGGLRSGKTTAGIMRMIKRAIEITKQLGTPGVGWFVVPDYATYGELLLRRFFQICPPDLVKNYEIQKRKITLANDFELWIKSGDDPKKLHAWGVHLIQLDEGALMPRLVWDNITARWEAGTEGVEAWVTTTIYSREFPAGYAWIDDVFLNPRTRWRDTAVFVSRSIDNPAFPKHEWERAKREYDEIFFAEKYEGQVGMKYGRVLQSFEEKRHYIDSVPRTRMHIVMGVDFGTSDPFAAVVIGITPDRKFYVIDSYKLKWRDLKYHAAQVASLVRKYKVKEIYADPTSGARRERQNFADLFLYLKEVGINLPFKQAYSAVYAGLSTINNLFEKDRIFIVSTVGNTELLREIRGYFWDDVGDKHANDHLIDAMRYVIATEAKLERDLFPDKKEVPLGQKLIREVLDSKDETRHHYLL